MGSNDNNSDNLPPWLRDDAPATPPPPPPPPSPPPSAEDENLPPWLREAPKREMLQGETLSDDWLSSADKLVESVDTELTYDEWYAMQKESARPKSIEEEVPDLLSDIPDEPAPEGTGALTSTGELPDWFLGLEELDTSDAPDWLIGTPEPVAPAEPEATPSWIDEVAEEEAPAKADDSVNDFFSSLNQGSTLPSGESMDDLFGEFAMPAPEPEPAEEELPTLDWVTGQSDIAAAEETYGAAEMEDFFSNLSQSAQSSETPREEVPALDWLAKAEEEPEEEPAAELESYLSSLTPALSTDEIEEPELDLFTGANTAAYPLPEIEIEPEEEEPVTQDPGAYTEETMSWLNELQGIVSAVSRDEDEEVVATPDDFFSTPEEKQAFEESVAGRGDEFDWPEPEPYEEPEPEESDWLSQLNMATGTSEMESVQLDEPDDRPAPKLTGMLNRMRKAEEPPAQEQPSTLFDDLPDRETPPTVDDDLETLFMTEDLLSEAESSLPAGFESAPAQQETDEPQWGESPAESEASGFGDDLTFDLDSLMSEASSSSGAAQDEVDFNLDDVLADLPADSSSNQEPGSGEAQPEEDDSFNFDELLGGLSSGSQDDSSWGSENSSPQNSLTNDEPELAPADWGDAPEQSEAPEWSPPQPVENAEPEQSLYPDEWGDAEDKTEQETEDEAYGFQPLTAEATETYEPQWGISEEEIENEETPSETESEAYGFNPVTAEAAETYEPQWGISEEETENEETPSENEDAAYGFNPVTAEATETYEPQWGISEEETENEEALSETENEAYGFQPPTAETYEPQWGAVLDDDSQEVKDSAENIAYSETVYEPEWDAAEQPVMSSPEGTGELDDMSWLTDDIFAETRGLNPPPNVANAEAAASSTDFFDSPQVERSEEAESQEMAGDEESLMALQSEPSDAEPQQEDYAIEQAEAEVAQEAQAALSETESGEVSDDFLTALQSEPFDAEPQQEDDAVGQAEADVAQEDQAVLSGTESDEASDDFLTALGMIDASDADEGGQQFDVEARRTTFDDDFLASLDTLDQMQASGQSHVGDDLFSSWDDQGENVTGDSPYDAAQIEVTDDFLNSLEFGESSDTGEAEAEPEGSEDFLSSMQPDEQSPESEQPDFFGAQDTNGEIEPPEFGDDFFAEFEPEDQPEPEEPFAAYDTADDNDASTEQSAFGDDFLAELQQPEPEEPFAAYDSADNDASAEQPTFDEEFFAALEEQSDAPAFGEAAQDEPAPQFDEAFFAELESQQQVQSPIPESAPPSDFDEEFFAALEAQSQEEQPAFDDVFSSSMEAEDQPEFDEMPSDADFLSSLTEESGDSSEDFFREMGMEESASAEEESAQQSEEDFFRTFEKPTPGQEEEEPDWLTSLTDPSAEAEQVEAVQPDDDMWLVPFDSTAEPVNPFVAEPPQGPIEDLDSYLASLRVEEAPLSPSTQAMFSEQDVDIDQLLEQPLIEEEEAPVTPFSSSVEPGVTPEWLSDVQASVGEVSAGAIVRQLKDRPEGELDDRLQKLRKRAKKLPTSASAEKAADPLANVLPELEESLTVAPIRTGKPSLAGGLALTGNQQERVALLKSLVPTETATAEPKRLSAIDLTYDSPYMPGLEDEESVVVHPEKPATKAVPRTARRTRQGIGARIEQFVITLVLAAGVISPFLATQLRVGSLPPQRFAAGSAQSDAFQYLDGLPEGALVLFAIEYSPASAAELDPMTDALLRHVLMQNAYPVVISGNPVALLRTTNLFTAINDDDDFRGRIGATRPLVANADYFLIRFIPGSTIGLRAFSEDTASLMLTDIRGQATGLNVRSLRDFPLMVVIADRAEDVRGYAEQVAPLANATVIAAVSYSAAPLVEPYVNAEFLSGPPALRGMLVGYGDAYTYNAMLDRVQAVERTGERPEQLLAAPETTGQLEAPPPATIATAVVTAAQSINVRPEPNTNNSPIARLQPGDVVEVIAFDDDGNWVNIRLPDGTEGWVSSQLVEIEEIPEAALPKHDAVAKANRSAQHVAKGRGQSLHRFAKPAFSPVLQQEETEEPEETEAPTEEAESTPRPTRTPRATPTSELGSAGIDFTLPPHSPEYRDERWYAMTFGIIVSATVISLGAVINIIRSILRRRR